MGILNVTPDSFSDGGLYFSADKAVAHGFDLISDGADFVDVGGESTRPGAEPVSISEEIRRVIPVVEALAEVTRVSIDTRHAEVAEAAVAAGACLINDISASLYEVAAHTGAGWVAMHMQGAPGTMQHNPQYNEVVEDVSHFLIAQAEKARNGGVNEIWIDPGIGFGKTVDHNLSLLGELETLTDSPWPVVVGTSRKSFLGKLLETGETPVPADDRLEGSLASAIWAATHGAAMVRVHDVRETTRSLRVVDAIQDRGRESLDVRKFEAK